MSSDFTIEQPFRFLGNDFQDELREKSIVQKFGPKTELMQEGQRVKYVPIVLSGLVKVYTMSSDRELVYYFVRPGQSCIMTFSTIFKDGISKVFASTDESSEVMLIPVQHMKKWIITYPEINQFFYKEYDLRYAEMIDMTNKVVFHRLDRRVMDYLQNKIEITGNNPVKVSHKEIANSLGTAREVVSRILKKFEHEGNVRQDVSGIEVVKSL